MYVIFIFILLKINFLSFIDPKSVVMGLSGNADDFIIDMEYCKSEGIRLINRFTGGGTVVIDENVLTFSIISTHSFIGYKLDPNNICQWVYNNYYIPSGIFKSCFKLIDGDYVVNINNIYFKVGGNAQSYNNYSFVQHTSFIWSISPLINKLLKIPHKIPNYRANRNHNEFITTIKYGILYNNININEFNNLLLNTNIKGIKYIKNIKLTTNFINEAINQFKNPNTKLKILP